MPQQVDVQAHYLLTNHGFYVIYNPFGGAITHFVGDNDFVAWHLLDSEETYQVAPVISNI